MASALQSQDWAAPGPGDKPRLTLVEPQTWGTGPAPLNFLPEGDDSFYRLQTQAHTDTS